MTQRTDSTESNLIVSIPKELHKKLKIEAIKKNMTLRQLVISRLIRR